MVDLKNLRESGFSFNKALGQNFITDTNLLRAICADADISNCDYVVEVGVGAGTLTKCLAERAEKVFGFEVDKRLEVTINQTLSCFDNVSIFFQDIMSIRMSEIENICQRRFKLVANLPYYITTPVIMKFIEESESVESITVMVQEEVARRLCAEAGGDDYGGISAVIRYAGTPKLTRKVSRQVFTPVPNVDSAVVNISLRKDRNKSEFEFFQKTVRAAFAMRRKTLVNNLSAAFNIDKETIKKLLADCGFHEKIRGEEIDYNGYIFIAEKLKQII